MKLFIWDFHGVLETGEENAVIEISNMALEELGYSERFTLEDCDKYYGIKWFQYFENLLPHKPHEEHIELQNKCFEIQDKNWHIVEKHIKQNDHAEDVLNAIEQKHRQILISNSRPESLEKHLRITNLKRFFNSKNTFGANVHTDMGMKQKEDILNGFLTNAGIEFEEIISIGDSAGDINLVKGFPNSKTYLYSHPRRKHKDVDATYRIRDLREILKEI